jgi:transposase
MDSHKHSTGVERLEVIETGRRRRWSDDEKLRIVLESLQTPRAISSTARRYGISRSLLVRWRRSFRPEPSCAGAPQAGFVPVIVASDETTPTMDTAPARGRMVIVVGKDRRVIVDSSVDATALARVLQVLEQR